jgi:O-acetyl-ADP-ribose deacetylase (regulator of RNase III)
MLTIIEGDLLEIKAGIILHQVNCRGATGGLAGALVRKWPQAFIPYFKECSAHGPAALGTCVVGEATPALMIGHVFGQQWPGPNTNLAAVNQAIQLLSHHLKRANLNTQVFAPFQIGCGLGGGDWTKYSAIIERHLPQCIIVRKYQ